MNSDMNGKSVVVIAVIAASFAALTDALAIGFEVDTPLDPFLGGLSKIKRDIVRRIKDTTSSDNFIDATPLERLNMIFGQQQQQQQQGGTNGAAFYFSPQRTVTRTPLSTYARKFGLDQIPLSLIQQMDAQLASYNIPVPNSSLTRRQASYQNSYGLGQAIAQQVAQSMTPTANQAQIQFNSQLPLFQGA